MSARCPSAKRIAHVHDYPVCNAITNTYSHTNFNPATYSNTQGHSDPEASPYARTAPLSTDNRGTSETDGGIRTPGFVVIVAPRQVTIPANSNFGSFTIQANEGLPMFSAGFG